MNRLQASKASSFDLAASLASHLPHSLKSLQASTRVAPRRRDRSAAPRYALFAPLYYERRYAYPLLIWLHDDGGSERELRQLMPHVSVRNYVAAAAHGTGDATGRRGHTWDQDAESAGEAAERVHECIDVAKRRFSVHADRVFIAGNGSGGTMALRLALQYPEWFAGAVSLGGPMPIGNSPLNRVKAARGLPLLLASCRDSEEYPQRRVADDLRLLHSAGFSLALRQYPGNGELTTVMLSDMDRWLMEQICPSPASATV